MKCGYVMANFSPPTDCECAYCKDQLDFDIDHFLIDEILKNNVVIFAGAGVSTEGAASMPHSLYDTVISAIGEEHRGEKFPDVVQRFVEMPDGYFRFVKATEERFDYINKFSNLRSNAHRFFKELSTMPLLNEYVTTNWDRYFEEICFAKPFVYDEDMRFWDIPRRKVLKIHGTIDNYSTLIASRTDYEKAKVRLQNSLIGGKLKEILTKRTCIFIGYSMRDDDFQEIYDFVKSSLGKFGKTHYFVSPNASSTDFDGNIFSINTDGAFFLSTLKEHLESSPCFVPDELFHHISDELDEVIESHHKTWNDYDPKKYPQALPSALYQDGLIDGYNMILDRRGTGEFSHSCEVLQKVDGYETKIQEYISQRRYNQIPYFTGYKNALLGLAIAGKSKEFIPPPHYFNIKPGEMDEDDFLKAFDDLPQLHKSSYKAAQKAMANLIGTEMVIQMQPWMV